MPEEKALISKAINLTISIMKTMDSLLLMRHNQSSNNLKNHLMSGLDALLGA